MKIFHIHVLTELTKDIWSELKKVEELPAKEITAAWHKVMKGLEDGVSHEAGAVGKAVLGALTRRFGSMIGLTEKQDEAIDAEVVAVADKAIADIADVVHKKQPTPTPTPTQ